MNLIIIQGIGYIALIFVLLSFQHNHRGNVIVGSYAGVTTEILLLISILLGVFRFDIRNKFNLDPRSGSPR